MCSATKSTKMKLACILLIILSFNFVSLHAAKFPLIRKSGERAVEGIDVSCPVGWVSHNGHCYYLHGECATNWYRALVTCMRQGATLVNAETSEEFEFLASVVDKDNQWWTAGRKNDNGDWVWINVPGSDGEIGSGGDDNEILNDLWNRYEPNNFSGTESVVSMHYEGYSRSWGLNDADPNIPNAFICESVEEHGYINTLCDSYPCQNGGSCSEEGGKVKCTCKEGFLGTWCDLDTSEKWYEFEGHSYQFFNTCGYERRMASIECRAFGGYLVSITSEAEMEFIDARLTELGYTNNHLYWWTGGKRKGRRGQWVWSERSSTVPLEYTKWGANEPNNHGGKELYIQLRWFKYTQPYNRPGFVFNDIRATKLAYFICERDQ